MTEILAALAAIVAGKRCRVIGAAPIPYPIRQTLLTVMAVNGGIASVSRANTDVWVVNARTAQDAKSHRLHATMVQQGAQRHVRLLVGLSKDEDDSYAQTLRRLSQQGTTWDRAIEINNSTRRRIEYLAGARLESEIRGTRGPMTKHALSAGLAAACFAFWADAESVTLEGFSWDAGYSYPTPYPVANRGHLAGDQLGLQRLQAQYGGRLFHTLTLPPFQESAMARVTDPHQRRLNRRARLGIAIQDYVGPLPRQVMATAPMVYYGNLRYREGERILLRDPKHFKPSQMRDVWTPADAPAQAPLPTAVERSEALADQMSGRGPGRRQRRGPARVNPDVGRADEELTGAGSRSVL